MTGPSSVLAAISAHRAAYDAFQVAPEGKAFLDAQDAYNAASDAVVATACSTRAGAVALLAHLRWWLTDEAEFADDYQPTYGIAQARVADLSLVVEPGTEPAVEPDPVFPALVAVRAATARHLALCEAMHEDDSEEAEQACDAGGDAVDETDKALAPIHPTTQAGLVALVEWYAQDAIGSDSGAVYLRRLLAILKHPDSAGRFSSPDRHVPLHSQEVGRAIPPAALAGPA